MTIGLPVSRLINVSVILTPRAASVPNLNSAIIIGDTEGVINVAERYRSYNDLNGVATDFGTTAPEYLAATLFFGQTPQPNQLFIGRWAAAATKGHLIGGPLSVANQVIGPWAAINNAEFKVIVNGGALTTVGPINLTGAANLNAVATLITTALGTAVLAANCVYNATYKRFEFNTTAAGAGDSVSFLQAPGAGTDISAMICGTAATGAYVADGIAAETAVAAYTILDALNFYFYGSLFAATTAINDAAYTAVAAYVEGSANKHMLGITSNEAGIITAGNTANIAYALQQLAYNRTFVQYSGTNFYAAASILGRMVTVDFTGSLTVINLMYQREPGVAPDGLTTSQADAAKACNANVYTTYNNNTMIIEYGTVASGSYIDDVYNTDWLALTIQTNVFNLLYTAGTKVPQTDAGNHLIANAIEAACQQGVVNGTLAPGQWNGPSFGQLTTGDFLTKGYYIFTPRTASQSTADRQARKGVTQQVAAKLAGAIDTVNVIVNVDR